MSSGNRGGGSSTNGSIPAASKKMVQSLKEIVNCPEAEIYAMLKECNMDPNEAVSRLLSQGFSLFSSFLRHSCSWVCFCFCFLVFLLTWLPSFCFGYEVRGYRGLSRFNLCGFILISWG